MFLSEATSVLQRTGSPSFIDETSKDGRDTLRKYAWTRINTPATVNLPFTRGERVFFAWESTPGTFDRLTFHEAFKTRIAPYINPWSLPRYLVVGNV
ncbi:Transposase [Phytophthora megakarya]|uniref:Transposase n=1 Tax=Phytophthora megakarya TaxID=4795 RepID=A0A225UYX4_9STRA|nr:Transposase [Phytophthora megakarya]